jgi:hypothetical protein
MYGFNSCNESVLTIGDVLGVVKTIRTCRVHSYVGQSPSHSSPFCWKYTLWVERAPLEMLSVCMCFWLLESRRMNRFAGGGNITVEEETVP